MGAAVNPVAATADNTPERVILDLVFRRASSGKWIDLYSSKQSVGFFDTIVNYSGVHRERVQAAWVESCGDKRTEIEEKLKSPSSSSGTEIQQFLIKKWNDALKAKFHNSDVQVFKNSRRVKDAKRLYRWHVAGLEPAT